MPKIIELNTIQVMAVFLIGLVGGKMIPDELGNVTYWLLLVGLALVGFFTGKLSRKVNK